MTCNLHAKSLIIQLHQTINTAAAAADDDDDDECEMDGWRGNRMITRRSAETCV